MKTETKIIKGRNTEHEGASAPSRQATLHKIGVGGVYKSYDGRATAVMQTRWTDATWGKSIPYFVWIARLDGKQLGEGSLNHCRKLIKQSRS